MIASFIVGMFFGGFFVALLFIPTFREKLFKMLNKQPEKPVKKIKKKIIK